MTEPNSTASEQCNTSVGKVASVGALLLLGSIATVVATIIAAAVTAPEPLLLPERLQEPVAAAAVPIPSHHMNEIIHFQVRRRDFDTITPALTNVIKAQGGYQLPSLAEGVKHYAVPEATGKWLATIDADNGKDAYAALGNPPSAVDSAEPKMATVQVQVECKLLQRPLVARIYLATGIAAVVGLLVTIFGNVSKPDP